LIKLNCYSYSITGFSDIAFVFHIRAQKSVETFLITFYRSPTKGCN